MIIRLILCVKKMTNQKVETLSGLTDNSLPEADEDPLPARVGDQFFIYTANIFNFLPLKRSARNFFY